MGRFFLEAKVDFFPHWILYALLGAIVLIAILRYQLNTSLFHLSLIWIKSPGTIPLTRQETSFLGLRNIILNLNYVLVMTVGMKMVMIYYQITFFWVLFIPLFYFSFQLLNIYLAGIISGEYKKIWENRQVLLALNQSAGIVLLPVLLLWYIYIEHSAIFVTILFVLFLLIQLFRIIRSVSTAISNKIWWYYIILYLCASEIWPIIVIILLFTPYFANS